MFCTQQASRESATTLTKGTTSRHRISTRTASRVSQSSNVCSVYPHSIAAVATTSRVRYSIKTWGFSHPQSAVQVATASRFRQLSNVCSAYPQSIAAVATTSTDRYNINTWGSARPRQTAAAAKQHQQPEIVCEKTGFLASAHPLQTAEVATASRVRYT
jgi:hypothetical protein